MESINKNNQEQEEKVSEALKNKESINYWKLAGLVSFGLLILILLTQLFEINIKPRSLSNGSKQQAKLTQTQNNADLEKIVLPQDGIILPVKWGSLGKQMVESGVIDKEKFESLYSQRGGLNEAEKKLLDGENNQELKIDAQNAGFLLNLLWGFGLANQNKILEEGPMRDSRYGGDASQFASTGGWSLAKGDAMEHYSKHRFVTLTEEQQKLVERVSQNIYRPCCGNSTYFPDCNHGMAMLGLLELLAAQGASEEEMYKTALVVNSYWFPDTYLAIAKYFEKRGAAWNEIDPKEILGSAYSSAQGYRQILSEIEPPQSREGGSCGV